MTDNTSEDAVRAAARALMEEQQQVMQEADERNPVLVSPRIDPIAAARTVLERFFTKDGIPQFAYYKETWYSYYRKLWSSRHKEDIESFVHGKLALCRVANRDGDLIPFPTTQANVSEIVYQIRSICTIPSHLASPCKLKDGRWEDMDAQGMMVARGELIHMESGRRERNTDIFIPNGAEWDYDPDAPKSETWEKFLDDLFGEQVEERQLLQEWFGYVLSGDRWAQKGLIIQGPKRSGKGTIGHVLSMLVGNSMVSSPALHRLGANFGLENLLDKRLCLVSDARVSNRIDMMSVIETLLRIVAHDPVDVDRKHKSSVQKVLDARVMMLTNTMPRLSDDSDAINSRFLILKLHESFYGREDHRLLDRLKRDLPAIANWAIEGYRRLLERGYFAEPASSNEARDDWYDESNPLSEFIKDRLAFDVDSRVEMATLYNVYSEWAEACGIGKMARNVLSRRLKDMLGSKVRQGKVDDVRYMFGISITGGDF